MKVEVLAPAVFGGSGRKYARGMHDMPAADVKAIEAVNPGAIKRETRRKKPLRGRKANPSKNIRPDTANGAGKGPAQRGG